MPCDSIQLVFGDNLQLLRDMQKPYFERITLAYMDPPFYTGRRHDRVIRTRQPTGALDRQHRAAFDDRWASFSDYLDALRLRVEAVRPLLAPHGCLVIHVDCRASHYVKVMVDDVFGRQCFASEIVWRYRRWPAKTHNFQRVHDVLLRWVKEPSCLPRFVQLYEPLAASTIKTWGHGKQRAVVGEGGRRQRSSTLSEASPGVALGDVWDIPIVAPVSRQRTGYPTQKPLALLDRLIAACTHEGDWVLDPYVGSGTALVASASLGRRCIGIDSSKEAIDVCTKRLEQLGLSFWKGSHFVPPENHA